MVCSDGVWEFLSNKQVCGYVDSYFKAGNPNGACDKLVDESLKNWKKEDEVVDDITAICVFLNKS